jgi:hypothetical protein
MSYGHDTGGVFDLAAQFSNAELDAKSCDRSSTTYGGRSLFSDREYLPDVAGVDTKLEQVSGVVARVISYD